MLARAREIAAFLGKELHGEDFDVVGVSDSKLIEEDTIAFLKKDSAKWINTGWRRALLLIQEQSGWLLSIPYIETDNPRRDFALVCKKFLPYPSAPKVSIGEHVKLGSGTVLGTQGFGIEWGKDGVPFRIPHHGGVVIGKYTEIGANCTIARGTIGDTVIGEHVFIDDQVFIAHNVQIGDRSLIIAKAEVSGSVKIGTDCWIGPSSCIREGLTIGNGALVGIGSVVVKDVEPGAVVAGNPAKFMRWRE